jgi:hypothetical protein
VTQTYAGDGCEDSFASPRLSFPISKKRPRLIDYKVFSAVLYSSQTCVLKSNLHSSECDF